ncbi:type II toxin-antitoxin system VapC family toxin [Stratiformator vulcanicus]|uniref:Ribonuclease VapC n=1 Tax=Stratiformator vulcanicus TaxID=2527980 RepID=A0A517QZ90_9PLAN|nr:type II toxin-antitoxin system VapC family toxin [Stratiformator vulcanicus]QDT36959.1 tRNA(fMet)-specific endonuclease VapC [Stratiformator vulcanicus]
MAYLLDTNVWIEILRGRAAPSLLRQFRRLRPDKIKLCSVVKAELYSGAERSANRDQNLLEIDRLCSSYESFPFDDQAALIFGKIIADLAREGKPIGAVDIMIASIAIARRQVLITHNISHLGRITDLIIEDWQTLPPSETEETS